MTQGEVITLVFTGAVAFVSGAGILLSFIKKWFTDPQVKRVEQQIEQTKVQSITNKQLAELATQMKHQNEMMAIRLNQHDIDIKKVDDRLTDSYLYLDDRVIDIEKVVFVKDYR